MKPCKCGCGTLVKRTFVHGHNGKIHKRYEIDKNGCWIWLLAISEDGYGVSWYNGKTIGAHQEAYIRKFGAISEGKPIDHKCKNIRCVNPDHLEQVTWLESSRRRCIVKLSVEIANKIRAEYGSYVSNGKGRTHGDVTYKALAKKYNVCVSTVCFVMKGRWLT